jgi:tetratricopeptide (TPR) repeat protein
MMRRSLSILFISLFSLCIAAQTNNVAKTQPVETTSSVASNDDTNKTSENLLKQAASLYSKGKYTNSAELYEQVLAQYGHSYKLYYNLGNAYYKCEKLAPAILNYERALRLHPGDRDARFNLEMCEARIVDKINPMGMFLGTRWFKSLENQFNSNTWVGISVGLFLFFIASLFAYFFARVDWLKKTGFFTGVITLLLSILALVYSAQEYRQITHPDEAILFTLSVTVKSSPDQSGTDLFVLHEGTKMKVLSVLGTWSEIELEDGNIGWLESKHIQVI